MSGEFTAYLDQVAARRADLGESIGALRAALAAPAPPRAGLVQEAMTELVEDLREHVAVTEAPQGLYADLRTTAPHLAAQIETQVREHAEFLTEAARLLPAAGAGMPAPSDAEVDALLVRIERHRKRGADLVYTAYNVDLGGMG